MSSNPEIFFSYAWGDEQEQGESREKIVNDLYDSLLKDKYQVIRDKHNLKYKGLISDFMGRIGKGNFIVVAISHKYFKSPYCMFELYEIARNSKFDKHLFSEKVLPIMIDFIDFGDTKIIKEYIEIWKTEFSKWENLVQENAKNLSIEQFKQFDQVKRISHNFAELAGWLVDMNTLNPRMLSEDNFAEIKKAIKEKGTEVLAEETIPTTKVREGSHKFGRRLKTLAWITAVLAGLITIFIMAWPFEKKDKDNIDTVIPSPPGFTTVDTAGEHLLIVQDVNTKKFGYALAADSSLFISCKYDEAKPFTDQMALVKTNGKYHWIKPDSSAAFEGQFDSAEPFENGEARVSNGKNNYVINKKGQKIEGKKPVVVVPVKVRDTSGIQQPVTEVPGEKMCRAVCDTRGIAGVEVSFTDPRPESNNSYKQVSGSDDLIFMVPCDLLDKPVKVTFKKDDKSEPINVMLKSFRIPNLFKTN